MSPLPEREHKARLGDAPAPETLVSDQVEAALRELLSEEVARLTTEGNGGSKCWPAVMLQIAAKQSRTPDAPRHAVAHLIAHVLNPREPVPQQHRTAVTHFCRQIAEQSRALAVGHLDRLKKTVRPFVDEMLEPLGEDRPDSRVSQTIGRQLTVQQLILRLDSHQPLDVQALAVKVLPDIVRHELRTAPRVAREREEKLRTLNQAVGMVGGTKYFESLTPKMREACESQMDELKHRIERTARRH